MPEKLLRDVIRIPSCDPPGGELAVAEMVHDHLLAQSIDSVLDEFQPGRANVLGSVKGAGDRPPLVFSAHLDTVPVGEQPWSFDPFAGDLHEEMIRGRGASDMKSAVACFVAAAAEITRSGKRLGGDLLMAFTAGESANCLGARRLVEQGFQARIGAFLCGEPSSLDLILAEKAILWVEATATGALGHVSGDPGVNAIDLMVDFLGKLRGVKLDLPPHPLLSAPTISVGTIRGGSAVNLTPDRCTAEIDIRFGPDVTVEEVLDQIVPVLPEGVTLRVSDFKPAVQEDPSSDFVAVCSGAVQRHEGRVPEIKGVSYYSDGAILLEGLDVPFAILGPGLLGMSGQADEVIPAENLQRAVRIYRQIAEDWLGVVG